MTQQICRVVTNVTEVGDTAAAQSDATLRYDTDFKLRLSARVPGHGHTSLQGCR